MDICRLLKKEKEAGKTALNEKESKQLLKKYGIPVISETVAFSQDEAVHAAQKIGFPVVLKGLGKTLLHKTERGLVHLNLTDANKVRQAACSIASKAGNDLEGFLVQPQIKGRREFLAGLFRDEQFGPIIMFGSGGIFTEVFSDVTFRRAPLTETDTLEMLDEIKAKPLLENFRGEKAVDRRMLLATLTALSRIGTELPEIAEIDINPLLITPEGKLCAVDALVIIEKKAKTKNFLPPVNPDTLGKFFYPKSIAFVGASSQFGKWGHTLLAATINGGFKGNIYVVNSKGGTIANKQAYRSVEDIPGKVDLAVVTIPASRVNGLLPQLKRKEIKNVLLITSGFGETGPEGKEQEENLVKDAREAGISILGPNTMGICNPHINLYCMGTHIFPKPGSTAMVAQSGNMGTQLLAFAEQQGIGIRGFAGSGNEAMVTIEDYLDAFEMDSLTRTIMLYIESVKNGRRFFESASRVGKKKPIVLLKGGQSQAGNKAAASHTGALSSDARIFNAACRQAGIVKVERPMDLLDLAAAFSSLPLPNGNRAAIITLGGGWGVVTADLCSEYGLEVPNLSPEIVERLDKILPPYWSRSNPVDLVGEHDNALPILVLEEFLKWDRCDAVINLGILGRKLLLGRLVDSVRNSDPSYSAKFLESVCQELAEFEESYICKIVELMETYKKPVLSVSILADKQDQTVYQVKNSSFKGVFYQTPERAVKAFAKMYEYQCFLNR